MPLSLKTDEEAKDDNGMHSVNRLFYFRLLKIYFIHSGDREFLLTCGGLKFHVSFVLCAQNEMCFLLIHFFLIYGCLHTTWPLYFQSTFAICWHQGEMSASKISKKHFTAHSYHPAPSNVLESKFSTLHADNYTVSRPQRGCTRAIRLFVFIADVTHQRAPCPWRSANLSSCCGCRRMPRWVSKTTCLQEAEYRVAVETAPPAWRCQRYKTVACRWCGCCYVKAVVVQDCACPFSRWVEGTCDGHVSGDER